jgi:tyrosyl-tRNA synthetase
MLLQAYDFLYLEHNHGCVLQMGGNDQWGNIVAGIDLIRRVDGKQGYGVTFPLITTSLGHKMGKTEKGTVWLDPNLTSPYEYYQYWVNVDDADVQRFLALFTYLPMDEIRRVRELADARLNMAKAVLAFEATKITHSEQAAVAAWEASQAAFGAKEIDDAILPSSSIPRHPATLDYSAMPSIAKSRQELESGVAAFELLYEAQLCSSKAEARRLISQGGAYVNNEQIKSFDEKIGLKHVGIDGRILLRKGKKKYSAVEIK